MSVQDHNIRRAVKDVANMATVIIGSCAIHKRYKRDCPRVAVSIYPCPAGGAALYGAYGVPLIRRAVGIATT